MINTPVSSSTMAADALLGAPPLPLSTEARTATICRHPMAQITSTAVFMSRDPRDLCRGNEFKKKKTQNLKNQKLKKPLFRGKKTYRSFGKRKKKTCQNENKSDAKKPLVGRVRESSHRSGGGHAS